MKKIVSISLILISFACYSQTSFGLIKDESSYTLNDQIPALNANPKTTKIVHVLVKLVNSTDISDKDLRSYPIRFIDAPDVIYHASKEKDIIYDYTILIRYVDLEIIPKLTDIHVSRASQHINAAQSSGSSNAESRRNRTNWGKLTRYIQTKSAELFGDITILKKDRIIYQKIHKSQAKFNHQFGRLIGNNTGGIALNPYTINRPNSLDRNEFLNTRPSLNRLLSQYSSMSKFPAKFPSDEVLTKHVLNDFKTQMEILLAQTTF